MGVTPLPGAFSEDGICWTFEQELADLRQAGKQLLIVINKAVPKNQENYLTWRYCCWRLNEIRKKIQNLEETRQIFSILL